MPDFEPIGSVDLDLIILTHCHLDHLGSLPVIAGMHPHASILTSIPNVLLAPRMLRNSVNVMKRQREEHGLVDYPLFLHRDIAHVNRSTSNPILTIPMFTKIKWSRACFGMYNI